MLEVAGTRLALTPERYLAVQASHVPGQIVLLSGGLLVFIGIVLPLIWPALQVWAELIPERRAVTVRLVARAQGVSLDVEEELERLAEALGGVA